MAFKTITIKERVYKELSRAKTADESFSDFFERMVHEKNIDLMEFAGIWKLDKDEKKNILTAMKDHRRRFEESFRERIARHRI